MNIRDFKLEHFFARWEFVAPYMLGSSDAESCSVTDLIELAGDECGQWLAELRLGYTEVQGHPELRRAIAGQYEGVNPDQVVVFSGAQEAIYAFMNVSLQADDHLVTIVPTYQSLYEVARAIGANVATPTLRHEDNWCLDLNALAKAVQSRTKVIAINYPHSPTGSHISRAEICRLSEIAQDVGAMLFSDEVYRNAVFREQDLIPAAVELGEHGVSLGVMSKAFGLAGLRIGWIASRHDELLRRLQSFKHYLTICNSAPAEVLATIALRVRDKILSRNRAIAARNLALLDEFFVRRSAMLEWVRPKAGTVSFPRLRSGLSVAEFVVKLAEEVGVLLLPGDVFDCPGNHFRLGFGRLNLPEALARLDEFLDRRHAEFEN